MNLRPASGWRGLIVSGVVAYAVATIVACSSVSSAPTSASGADAQAEETGTPAEDAMAPVDDAPSGDATNRAACAKPSTTVTESFSDTGFPPNGWEVGPSSDGAVDRIGAEALSAPGALRASGTPVPAGIEARIEKHFSAEVASIDLKFAVRVDKSTKIYSEVGCVLTLASSAGDRTRFVVAAESNGDLTVKALRRTSDTDHEDAVVPLFTGFAPGWYNVHLFAKVEAGTVSAMVEATPQGGATVTKSFSASPPSAQSLVDISCGIDYAEAIQPDAGTMAVLVDDIAIDLCPR